MRGKFICIGILIILFLVCSADPIIAGSTGQNSYNIDFPKTEFVETGAQASSSQYSYAIMHPTVSQLKEWNTQYLAEKSAGISASQSASALGETSVSLLEFLNYTPSDRDQQTCGNCWVWASTGAIEIAHTVQNDVSDRLSIQYLNSKYNNGGNSPFSSSAFACNGGTASKFSSFYNLVGKYGGNKTAIPWSNGNAAFQDGNASQGHTLVNADTIKTVPNYAMNTMSANRIETIDQTQPQAIANIKNILENGKAVYLQFYLPDQNAWDSFKTFWASGIEEETFFDIDQFAGSEFTSSGGGHAVLVTGYIDDGTSGYWQCLNSWGAPTNRQNGLFYIDMHMDYSAMYTLSGDIVPVTTWQTVDVTYVGAEPTPNGTITLTPDFVATPSSGYPPLTVHFTDLSEGSPSTWKWNFGDGGGSTIRNPNHTYAQPGRYSVSLGIGKGGQTAITEQSNAITVKIPFVHISPFPNQDGGFYPIPTDQDGDGRFEDINGNGWLEFTDPLVFLKNMEYAMKKEPVLQFDFDSSGFIGYGDIVALQKMV